MELDYRDSRPIYLQLVDRLRREILEGILGEGERLPCNGVRWRPISL